MMEVEDKGETLKTLSCPELFFLIVGLAGGTCVVSRLILRMSGAADTDSGGLDHGCGVGHRGNGNHLPWFMEH